MSRINVTVDEVYLSHKLKEAIFYHLALVLLTSIFCFLSFEWNYLPVDLIQLLNRLPIFININNASAEPDFYNWLAFCVLVDMPIYVCQLFFLTKGFGFIYFGPSNWIIRFKIILVFVFLFSVLLFWMHGWVFTWGFQGHKTDVLYNHKGTFILLNVLNFYLFWLLAFSLKTVKE